MDLLPLPVLMAAPSRRAAQWVGAAERGQGLARSVFQSDARAALLRLPPLALLAVAVGLVLLLVMVLTAVSLLLLLVCGRRLGDDGLPRQL